LGLAGLFDASPVHVINPTMIAAANSTCFNPPVIERGAAVGAVGMNKTDATELIAKKQQLFAKPAHEFRRLTSDLTGETNRQPVFSQSSSRWSSGPYSG